MTSEYRTLYTEADPGYSDLGALAPELRKGVEKAEETEPGLWEHLTGNGESADAIFRLKEGFDQTRWNSKEERRLAADQAALAFIPL